MTHKSPGDSSDIPEEVLSIFDRVLVGSDLQTKVNLYRAIEGTQIEPNDPMFLPIAVVTQAKLAIAPIPGELKALSDDIKAHLVTLQSLSRGQIQDCHNVAADIHVTAKRLSIQMARQASSGTSPVFSFLWAFFGAVSGSVLIFVLQRFL